MYGDRPDPWRPAAKEGDDFMRSSWCPLDPRFHKRTTRVMPMGEALLYGRLFGASQTFPRLPLSGILGQSTGLFVPQGLVYLRMWLLPTASLDPIHHYSINLGKHCQRLLVSGAG